MKALHFLAATLCVLLSGCAGTRIAPTADSQALSDKAVVVFSVSHDKEGGPETDAIVYLDIDRFLNKGVFKSSPEIVPLVPKNSDYSARIGQLYVLELDAGTHQFDTWQVDRRGIRTVPRVNPPPLMFQIHKGEIVYLGNIHLRMAVTSGLLGAKEVLDAQPVAVDASAEDLPLAMSRVPALTGHIQIRMLPLGPWIAEPGTRKVIDPLPPPLPLKTR